MKGLMHCPFCTSGDVQLGTDIDSSSRTLIAYIHCNGCDARGPRCVHSNVDARALLQWNTRPTLDEETVLRVAFKLTE